MQRINVNFCVNLEKSFIQTFDVLQTACGNETLNVTQMYEWWKCLKGGQTSTSKTGETVAQVTKTVYTVIR